MRGDWQTRLLVYVSFNRGVWGSRCRAAGVVFIRFVTYVSTHLTNDAFCCVAPFEPFFNISTRARCELTHSGRGRGAHSRAHSCVLVCPLRWRSSAARDVQVHHEQGKARAHAYGVDDDSSIRPRRDLLRSRASRLLRGARSRRCVLSCRRGRRCARALLDKLVLDNNRSLAKNKTRCGHSTL